MLNADYSGKFKKDLKLMEKRDLDMEKIFSVMLGLQNEIPLHPKYQEHFLTGNYKGFLECHVEPNWLLIYQVDEQAKEIYFARTGTHSDLFK